MKFVPFSLALLISTNVLAADPVKVAPVATKMIGSENGRFVFGQISDFRADRFMLDTQTGRLYQLVVSVRRDEKGEVIPNGEIEYLSPVPYRSAQGTLVMEPDQTPQASKK